MELLVAMTLSLVVFGGVGVALISGMNEQARVLGKTGQLEQAETGLQQVVRDLREATSVTYVSSSAITYHLPVATGSQSVSFSCSASTDACTRTITGAPAVVISHVTNTDVFTMSPSTSSPSYVAIKLVVAAAHQQSVTLTDGAGLRNVTLGK